jgi:cytochrome c-type biogenesis protein CcmH/NrfG
MNSLSTESKTAEAFKLARRDLKESPGDIEGWYANMLGEVFAR